MTAQQVPVEPYSDGDATHRPKPEWKLVFPPDLYLEKLGTLWMQKRGQAKPGVRYFLTQLPEAYALFERPRANNPKHSDKHLYGHPGHKYFDSPNRFFPHFEHLMNNGGSNTGCPCTVCNSAGAVPLPMGSTVSKGKAKAPITAAPQAQTPVDDENTPDMIRQLISRLELVGTLDEPIEETRSMDWRAEQQLLPGMLQALSNQRSWIPRVAELVLFVRDVDHEICYDASMQEYKVFNEQAGKFLGHPRWEAGVVGQTAEESITLEDAIVETEKRHNVSYSGFRVEPFPNPNSRIKVLSKQHKYVPLHHIRPFVFWKEFMKGVSEDDWHPTIKHALTVMASMSLLDKYHFRGNWPEAAILSRGIYIGSEFIVSGDVVRLLPSPGTDVVTDVLQINSIKLKLRNLDKAGDDDNDDGHPYNSAVYSAGSAYTLDIDRAWSKTPVSQFEGRPLPLSMHGYDEWYLLHDPAKQYQISFTRIIGRCFEAEPMLLWFPVTTSDGAAEPRPNLSKGLGGIREARKYSSLHDKRIPEGKFWFWGDNRAETLDIAELNGLSLSAYDQERDEDELDLWQESISIMDKYAKRREVRTVKQATLVERPVKGSTTYADTTLNIQNDRGTEIDVVQPIPRSGGGIVVLIDDEPVDASNALEAFKKGARSTADASRKRSRSLGNAENSSTTSRGKGMSEESEDVLITRPQEKPFVLLGSTGAAAASSTVSTFKKPRVDV